MHGHGTHVSGSVLGNGALSGGQFAGVAPQASIVFQSIDDDVYDPYGNQECIPLNLKDNLFKLAYDRNARLHSNSWGGPTGDTSNPYGGYDADARGVDDTAWNYRDMLLLFAAGNSGVDTNADGLIDSDSIGSPGTAKNVLTVGATENNRPSVSTTYGDPRNTRHKYLLRRRVSCGRCGLKMAGRTFRNTRGKNETLPYYCCPSNNKYATVRDCDAPYFRADYLDALAWEWIKTLVLDPEILDDGLQIYQDNKNSENTPYVERIKVIDGLIGDNGEKLERLIDLYLSGAVAKDLLVDRQQRLENNLAVLTKERGALVAQMKQRALTSEEIQSIRELAERTAKGLLSIDGCDDFESRKCIIDALDVTASVEVDGETRIANLKCILAETRLPITDKQIHEIVLFVG